MLKKCKRGRTQRSPLNGSRAFDAPISVGHYALHTGLFQRCSRQVACMLSAQEEQELEVVKAEVARATRVAVR